jgi:hypothetical protein
MKMEAICDNWQVLRYSQRSEMSFPDIKLTDTLLTRSMDRYRMVNPKFKLNGITKYTFDFPWVTERI